MATSGRADSGHLVTKLAARLRLCASNRVDPQRLHPCAFAYRLDDADLQLVPLQMPAASLTCYRLSLPTISSLWRAALTTYG